MSSEGGKEQAVVCEGIGKRYFLGEESNVFTVTEYLSGLAGQLLGRKRGTGERKSFWALKNVSFELAQGRVMGVIGRNGAGKSTLLKVLSRITPPSEGRFEYRGRIASLLEVGTGFKQELTGRDNIFMNGTLLGLSRREIRDRLDEITAFAEIDRFLDTPVKRYSSGMFVRLAFAVAAHLEPDILLIDEVLAVGDLRFQKKCLNKMGSVAKEGRTVMFVSHNMQAVSQLCDEAILLEKGQLTHRGEVKDVVSVYQDNSRTDMGGEARRLFEPRPQAKATIREITLYEEQAEIPVNCFDIMSPICFEFHFEVQEDLYDCQPIVRVHSLDGMTLISSIALSYEHYLGKTDQKTSPRKKGRYVVRGEIPAPVLNTGFYELVFALSATHDEVFDSVAGLVVEVTDCKGSFSSAVTSTRASSLLACPVKWEWLEA